MSLTEDQETRLKYGLPEDAPSGAFLRVRHSPWGKPGADLFSRVYDISPARRWQDIADEHYTRFRNAYPTQTNVICQFLFVPPLDTNGNATDHWRYVSCNGRDGLPDWPSKVMTMGEKPPPDTTPYLEAAAELSQRFRPMHKSFGLTSL